MKLTQEEIEQALEGPNMEEQTLLSTLPFPPADEKFVRFYARTKLDELATKGGTVVNPDGTEKRVPAAGRPIYKQVPYVEILTPGDKDNIVDRPVRGLDRHFWPNKWRAFIHGQSQESVGTPLALCGISPERIEELAHFKIKTVEALAQVSDGNLQTLGIGVRGERQKALDYLATMKGNAPVAALRSENEQMKSEMEALRKQMAEILAAQKAEAKPQTKKEQR